MNTVEVAFTLIRRLVTFGLGCWIIGNALVHPDERISQLIVGMIMVGVLPIENVFSWRVRRTGRPGRVRRSVVAPKPSTRGDVGATGGR